jgi:hypothetical protein
MQAAHNGGAGAAGVFVAAILLAGGVAGPGWLNATIDIETIDIEKKTAQRPDSLFITRLRFPLRVLV